MNSSDKASICSILRRTLHDYKSLRSHSPKEWPELELVALTLTSTPVQTGRLAFDAVTSAISDKNQTGWARFQSGLDWTGSHLTPDYEDIGAPIYAEWTLGAETSCRLRLDADMSQQAKIWTYRERILSASEEPADHETIGLRKQTSLLGNTEYLPECRLGYNVYWASGPGENAHALRRRFDRFTGILKDNP